MALQTFTAGQVLTAAQMTSLQADRYNQTVSTKTASYVLVAGDVGTRVVMNSSSATTITVNTSIFAAGDTLWIHNIGSGTCTITAGTATVSTSGSLALGQNQGGTLYFTSAGVAIFFPTVQTSAQGLTLINTTSFSGVASQNVTNVFSSTYTNYQAIITIDSVSSTGASDIRFRFGTSGTPNSNSNYNNTGLYVDTTIQPLLQSGAGKIGFGYLEFSPSSNTGTRISIIDICNPFETKQTYAFSKAFGTQFRVNMVDIMFDLTTSFTDFQIFPSANNITGSISVYGYNK